MNTLKIVAILLLIGGAIGLAFGGFSYISETHRADLGPLHIAVNEKQTVNIPLWVSLAALVGGAALLLGARKS